MNPQTSQPHRPQTYGLSRLNAKAYQTGYLQGKALEREIQDENHLVRDNNNAARGLLWGITLAVIAMLLGGTIFLLIQTQQASSDPTPSVSAPQRLQP